jgi:asparagine synthase (glutamine-hydrolysing)
MAHLAIVVDDDPERRDTFLAATRRLFGELPGLTIGERRHERFACVWAAGPRAPIDVHEDPHGCSIFIGYGIAADDRRVAARDLRTDWLAPASRPQLHDGYHIGAAWSPSAGLVAGVDAMGMFPLHWAGLGAGGPGPLVAATTPEVFRCHPLFTARIDRRGLAGILHAHGPLFDRPLLADTRRLPKGHLLRLSRDRGAGEEPVSRLARPSPPPGESLPDLRQRIAHEHLTAIRRHAPPTDDTAILLSGGLDSRLVAASLGRLGIPTRAIALGRADDFEVRAADAVARRLEIPLEVVSTEAFDAEFPARARRAARFGHLAAAPGADDFAEGTAAARSAGRVLWAGIAYDWI